MGWVSDPLESWMYSCGNSPVRKSVSGTLMVEVMKRKSRPLASYPADDVEPMVVPMVGG